MTGLVSMISTEGERDCDRFEMNFLIGGKDGSCIDEAESVGVRRGMKRDREIGENDLSRGGLSWIGVGLRNRRALSNSAGGQNQQQTGIGVDQSSRELLSAFMILTVSI